AREPLRRARNRAAREPVARGVRGLREGRGREVREAGARSRDQGGVTRMKVYVLDEIYPGGVELVSKRAEVVRWDDPRKASWHDDADGLMIRLARITADDLARAKRLKVIVKQGVGVDNIDLAAARDRGVVVCNTPGVNADAVAELTLG